MSAETFGPRQVEQHFTGQVWLDADLCSGCGLCSSYAPDVFQLSDNGYSEVHIGGVPTYLEKDSISGREFTITEQTGVENAAENCPGEVIFIEPIE